MEESDLEEKKRRREVRMRKFHFGAPMNMIGAEEESTDDQMASASYLLVDDGALSKRGIGSDQIIKCIIYFQRD